MAFKMNVKKGMNLLKGADKKLKTPDNDISKEVIKSGANLFMKECFAEDSAGEMALSVDITPALGGVTDALTPFKVIVSSVKSLFANVKGVLSGKNKKPLIFAVSLAAVWMLLNILQAAGVNNGFVRFLNNLTFASGGGLERGFMGTLGGFLGKGIVAGALFSIFDGNAANTLKGIKSNFSPTAFSNKENLPFALMGAGAAFIALRIFAGRMSMEDIMAPIASIILLAEAAGRKNGFIVDFIKSLFAKNIKCRDKEKFILAGINIGLLIGMLFIAVPWLNNISVIMGVILIISGMFLAFGDKKGKEVPKQ